MHHYFDHEFLVLCILPSNEIGSELSRIPNLTTIELEKREEISKFEQEFRKEELVDFYLDVFGELFQHFPILLIVDSESEITIVSPSVFEILLKLFFELSVDRAPTVEFADHGEKPIQRLGIVVFIRVHAAHLLDHFPENSQYITENCVTGQ